MFQEMSLVHLVIPERCDHRCEEMKVTSRKQGSLPLINKEH